MLISLYRCLFILFFIVGLPFIIKGQYPYTPGYTYPEFQSQKAHELSLHVHNHNFVRNNEYNSGYLEGQTLIGYGLQPTLTYYAGDRLRLRSGLYLRQFSGEDHYSKIQPVFSAHLRLSPSVDVIMGGLRGHVYHRLPEPFFDSRRQYSSPLETGLQFLVNRPWLWMDTWIDWEQFISEGDNFPEKFTAGLSAEPSFHLPGESWQVTLPLHLVAVHHGGEISDYDQPVQTSVNGAIGGRLQRKFSGFLEKGGVFVYGMNYNNLNDKGPLDINRGNAWYTGVMAEGSRFGYMAGYFRGHDFLALRGQGLFQSYSPADGGQYFPDRELFTTKIGYNRTFLEKIMFSFLLETYYDIPGAFFDFNASMQISFSPEFFLTKTKFQ